jgi:hypothetical protein
MSRSRQEGLTFGSADEGGRTSLGSTEIVGDALTLLAWLPCSLQQRVRSMESLITAGRNQHSARAEQSSDPGARHFRRRCECRGALGGARRAWRDLYFQDGARPYRRPAPLRLRGHGRAERQEHRSPRRVYALRPEAVATLPRPSAPARTAISQPAVAPRLSIVVLPFSNLRDHREQQYFADGITEDLTTDLSRIANMFVISRNTAFTYRAPAGADAPEAAIHTATASGSDKL